jgi:hypothetical protein
MYLRAMNTLTLRGEAVSSLSDQSTKKRVILSPPQADEESEVGLITKGTPPQTLRRPDAIGTPQGDSSHANLPNRALRGVRGKRLGLSQSSVGTFFRTLHQGGQGLSLLEIAVVLALGALITPLMGRAAGQFTRVPAEQGAKLAATISVRAVSSIFGNDMEDAQSFLPGSAPVYGSFDMTDFTLEPRPVRTAAYSYDSKGRIVVRETQIRGEVQERRTAASEIARFEDVSIAANQATRETGVRQTRRTGVRQTIAGPSQELVFETTFLRGSAAPIPPAPPRKPPQIRDAVLFSGGDITVTGKEQEIVGGVVARGRLLIPQEEHTVVVGDVVAVGGLGTRKDKHILSAISTSPSGVAPPLRLDPASFEPCDFTFFGDVDLRRVDHVWQDPEKKRTLVSGVYCALTGKLDLDGSGVTGQVTFVAKRIELSAKRSTLTPFRFGVLALALGDPSCPPLSSGDDAIEAPSSCGLASLRINEDRVRLSGVLYAENGDIQIREKNHLIDGAVVAVKPRKEVSIHGSHNRLILNLGYLESARKVSKQ